MITVTFELTKEDMQRIIQNNMDNDVGVDDLTAEDLAQIKLNLEEGLKDGLMNEPHYAFDDYVHRVVQNK